MVAVSQRITSEDRIEAKKVSIVWYLERMGIKFVKDGNRYVCSSPIKEEDNPSFHVYPENTFYDFSSGVGGDIIELVKHITGEGYISAIKKILASDVPKTFSYKKVKNRDRIFNISHYIREDNMVSNYISDRKLISGYCKEGFRLDMLNDCGMMRMPSVVFPHIDECGRICGAKFRSVVESYDRRYSSRGMLRFHLLENIISDEEPIIYITESETSSHSLFRLLQSKKINFVIICIGSVTNIPKVLPYKWEWCSKRILIIDFDGNEKKWKERCNEFKHLNCRYNKIEMSKYEDFNSLHLSGDLFKEIDVDSYGRVFRKTCSGV